MSTSERPEEHPPARGMRDDEFDGWILMGDVDRDEDRRVDAPEPTAAEIGEAELEAAIAGLCGGLR